MVWRRRARDDTRSDAGHSRVVARVAGTARSREGLIVQNRLLQPHELEPVDGRQRFYVENQGVWEWAFELGRDDPVVWSREYDSGKPWQAEREPLSRFHLQVVPFESAMSAPHAAATSMLTLRELGPVLEPMERLNLGAWLWRQEPTWFYAGHDTLAVVNPNLGPVPGFADTFDIVIGARGR